MFLTVVTGAGGGLLFAYFGALPLLLAGLSGGLGAGTLACVSGLLLAGVMGGAVIAVIYGVSYALPAVIVIGQGLRQRGAGAAGWYPAGHILCSLTVAGLALMVLIAPFYWSADGVARAAAGAQVDQFIEAWQPMTTVDQRAPVVGFVLAILPGMVGASWILMAVVNATAAHGLLSRFGRSLRPAGTLSLGDLPLWMSWLLVAAAALALAGPGSLGEMGRNLVMVAAAPFFFVGLSLVHRLARRTQVPGLILTVFYFLVIVSAWLAMLVAGLGIVDQWVGLRRRIPGAGSGKGKE